jgi:hypothetical protein
MREGGRCCRKNFENSGELGVIYIENRNDKNGADAKTTGDDGIDARIELGIHGKLRLTSLQTRPGKTVASVERNA